jgi:hypothetical protein
MRKPIVTRAARFWHPKRDVVLLPVKRDRGGEKKDRDMAEKETAFRYESHRQGECYANL